MLAFREVRPWKQRIDAHIPHNPPSSLPVDLNTVISSQNRRDRSVPPGRFVGVDPVDPAANAQFLVIQKFDHLLAVDTRSVNAQQFALAFYRDCGIFLVHQVRGFDGVAWFVILHLFF